jgi:quercetin dioxygenase-like cupin family protein
MSRSSGSELSTANIIGISTTTNVVSGQLLIDLEDRCIDLTAGKAVVIPKGVTHRPRAPKRTVILMVERAGIVPTGT